MHSAYIVELNIKSQNLRSLIKLHFKVNNQLQSF